MSIDPSILAALDEERGVASARTNNYRTLKLEKRESALARFLPAQLGPRKTWFARIARHWVGGRPYVCVRQTSADFGGNPSLHCPLCELEQKYLQDRDQTVRDQAKRIGAFPKWLMFCFVWEMIDERNRSVATPKNEIYIPNEFWVTRDGYLELSNAWERSLKVCSPYGFLDPVRGNDYLITRDSRNTLKFQREGETAIMAEKSSDDILDIIDAAMANVKLPDTAPPTPEKMDELIMKAEDTIRGRRRTEADVDSDEERRGGGASGRRSDSTTPSTRGRYEDRPAGGDERGSSRRGDEQRRSEPAPERSRAEPERERGRSESAVRSEPAARSEPGRESRRAPPPPGEEDFHEAQPVVDGAAAAATATGDVPPPSLSRRRSLTPPPARGASGGRVDTDAEELPPERRDPAPAAPAATAAASTAQRALSADMRSRVSRLGGAEV